MTTLTSDIARFVSELSLNQVPGQAIDIVKTGFADCFGVMIAGAREPFVGLVDRELGSSDRAARASLIPSGEQRNAEHAALVNGVAARAGIRQLYAELSERRLHVPSFFVLGPNKQGLR
jgi:2-methylcitrate dehydratase PrpD